MLIVVESFVDVSVSWQVMFYRLFAIWSFWGHWRCGWLIRHGDLMKQVEVF